VLPNRKRNLRERATIAGNWGLRRHSVSKKSDDSSKTEANAASSDSFVVAADSNQCTLPPQLDWLVDSEVTQQMRNDSELFEAIIAVKRSVCVGGDASMKAIGIGSVGGPLHLYGKERNAELRDAQHVPKLTNRLFWLNKCMEKCYKVAFHGDRLPSFILKHKARLLLAHGMNSYFIYCAWQ